MVEQSTKRKKPGVRAAATRDRRREIGEAAMSLFLERGVAATRVEDILECSGASIGSFYHHFGDKLDLAATLYLDLLELLYDALLEELGQHQGTRQGVEGVVRRYLRWATENTTATHYLMHCREPNVAQASEGREARLNERFFGELTRWLDNQAEAGEIRHLTTEQYYALWMGPADQLLRGAIDVFGYFAKTDAEVFRTHLEQSEDLMADAAWTAIRSPRN